MRGINKAALPFPQPQHPSLLTLSPPIKIKASDLLFNWWTEWYSFLSACLSAWLILQTIQITASPWFQCYHQHLHSVIECRHLNKYITWFSNNLAVWYLIMFGWNPITKNKATPGTTWSYTAYQICLQKESGTLFFTVRTTLIKNKQTKTIKYLPAISYIWANDSV